MNSSPVKSWEARYRSENLTPGAPHSLVLRAAEELPPGRALDLACGLGRHALALAERGWQVIAVDASATALEKLQAAASALPVQTVLADLEAGAFVIEPAAYDLVVVTCYLQRDLFAAIRAGLRPGGLFVGAIAVEDADPQVRPMNPAFLLQPGELASYFAGWALLHNVESKPEVGRRTLAELLARRP